MSENVSSPNCQEAVIMLVSQFPLIGLFACINSVLRVMRDEEYATQTLSKTTFTPGASDFQLSHSTERKSASLIRIAVPWDRGSADTRSSKGEKTDTVGKQQRVNVRLGCMYS